MYSYTPDDRDIKPDHEGASTTLLSHLLVAVWGILDQAERDRDQAHRANWAEADAAQASAERDALRAGVAEIIHEVTHLANEIWGECPILNGQVDAGEVANRLRALLDRDEAVKDDPGKGMTY